jgi:hypothetical protein
MSKSKFLSLRLLFAVLSLWTICASYDLIRNFIENWFELVISYLQFVLTPGLLLLWVSHTLGSEKKNYVFFGKVIFIATNTITASFVLYQIIRYYLFWHI